MGGSSGFPPVGSTFKPFVLQQWLESGNSIYDTISTRRQTMSTFPASCLDRGRWYENPGYNPDNAVSVKLNAMETVLNGTKFSVNTVYANMARQLDLCSIADTARSLGVVPPATYNPYDQETWDADIADIYGTELAPPAVLVLGELRISALQMASAYATWADGGVYCEPQAISEVLDSDGEPMEITGSQCEQVVDKEVADTIAWVLEQDLEDPRATGKGKTIDGHDAGGKTGTSIPVPHLVRRVHPPALHRSLVRQPELERPPPRRLLGRRRVPARRQRLGATRSPCPPGRSS